MTLLWCAFLAAARGGCADESDCGWNGACSENGACVCRSPWEGPECQRLALADRHSEEQMDKLLAALKDL